MILGNAEHHKEASARPIRFAELPKAAAESVHPGCRHIDRAEPAMRGEVRGPKLSRPITGQRLALIAAGEEGEFLRVALTDCRQPADSGCDRLLPFDFAELTGATFADPSKRLSQLRRGVLLHDAGRALAADHAPVDRVVAVTFDVADAAVLEVNFDPATAGTHIASGAFDLVRHPGRSLHPLSWREIIADTLAKIHPVFLVSITSRAHCFCWSSQCDRARGVRKVSRHSGLPGGPPSSAGSPAW